MPPRTPGREVLGFASGFKSHVAHARQTTLSDVGAAEGTALRCLTRNHSDLSAVINLFKIPAYLALGQFTHENLMAASVA